MPARKSAAVEAWFARTKPPSEKAMRRVRDVVLGADRSMGERVQYGITFSSARTGDLAAFVRYREPGVNLRFHRGGRLRGRYPHLSGRGSVWRMRIANVREANARAAELRAIVKEWCALSEAAVKPKKTSGRSARAGRSARRSAIPTSAGARR